MAKTCSTCRALKPLTDFHRDRRFPDGRRRQCKSCVNIRQNSPSAVAARKKYWASFKGQTVRAEFRERHKTAIRAADRERRATRIAEINAIKLANGCVDCGYREHPAALEFDHRDPTRKRTEISRMALWSWATIIEEIAKCDIRCANCHRVRTISECHSVRWRTRVPSPNLPVASEGEPHESGTKHVAVQSAVASPGDPGRHRDEAFPLFGDE